MSSRLDFLIRKLDELEDAIRLEKKEYDKARDRYDKMTRREILEDLRGQFLGYQTERDQLQRARSSAREKLGQSQPAPPQKAHPPRHAASAPNTQRSRQQAPPPPQHKMSYPRRPAPQHRDACPPRNNYGPSGNTTGQTRGQPSNNSNGKQRAAPPRPHQKSQTLDFEIEEPDGRSYIVRGEAVWRDFDPARDKVRKTGLEPRDIKNIVLCSAMPSFFPKPWPSTPPLHLLAGDLRLLNTANI